MFALRLPRRRSAATFLAAAGLALAVTGCQQAPAEVEGHKVTKTEKVKGKEVNFLQSTDDDLEKVRLEAAEMKKSADNVVFTPDDQKEGKK